MIKFIILPIDDVLNSADQLRQVCKEVFFSDFDVCSKRCYVLAEETHFKRDCIISLKRYAYVIHYSVIHTCPLRDFKLEPIQISPINLLQNLKAHCSLLNNKICPIKTCL